MRVLVDKGVDFRHLDEVAVEAEMAIFLKEDDSAEGGEKDKLFNSVLKEAAFLESARTPALWVGFWWWML